MKFGESLRAFLFSQLPKIPRPYWAMALLAWTTTLTILAVSHGPQLPREPWASLLWNLMHAPAYGLLAPLCLYSLPRIEGRLQASAKNLRIALAAVLLVGISNEMLQGMTSYRSFSLWDWASDAAGGIAFLGIFRLCRDAAPSEARLAFYACLSSLLCLVFAWIDSFGLSF